MAKIKGFFHDEGGLSAIAPTFSELVSEGHELEVHLAGGSAKKHLDKKTDFPEGATISTLTATGEELEKLVRTIFRESHDLSLIGTSQSVAGTNVAIAALEAAGSTRALTVEDRYGSAVPMLKQARSQTQLTVCVNDGGAQAHMEKRLMDGTEVLYHGVVTGSPGYDKWIALRGAKFQEKRRELRNTLDLGDHHILCLIAGQMNDTATQLKMVEDMATKLGIEHLVKVIARPHPSRMSELDKQQCDQYYRSTRREWFLNPAKDFVQTTDEILPAAEIVMSGYSTTNYVAMLLGLLGVVFIGTTGLRKDLAAEKELSVPAEVEGGLAWYAKSAQELTYAVRAVCLGLPSDKLAEIKRKRREFDQIHDGGATRRVLREINELLHHHS